MPGLAQNHLGQVNFASSKSKSYYIAIYDAKLEPMNYIGENSLWKNTIDLELTEDIYDLLKIYLIANNEIATKLDDLFLSKPIANDKQIIDLINAFNTSVQLNKD